MADTQWSRRFFINAASAGCLHLEAEAITTVDGERVGYLCPHCDSVLAADWRASPITSGVLSGVGACWVEENAVMANGHRADECPARVEVTGIADREPQYVHGNCEPARAAENG